MSDLILEERVELRKGTHVYTYDPTGFDSEEQGVSPVLSVDDKVISVNKAPLYLICDCDDYQERQRRFEANESYSTQGRRVGWDDMATCKHITLLRRYFGLYLMERVLEKISETEPNPIMATRTLALSREGGMFSWQRELATFKYLQEHKS